MTKKTIVAGIGVIIILFIIKYIFSVFAVYLLPQLEWKNEKYGNTYLAPASATNTKPIINMRELWNKWDSTKYIDISQNGYEKIPFESTKIHNWAFYPLYPLIISFVSSWFSYLANMDLVFITGIFISSIFLFLSILLLRKLAQQLHFQEDQLVSIIVLLISFPSAYFFQLFYPESLYLFLTLVFFYFLFKKRYFYSSLMFSLALVTRPNAVALVLPFYFYYFIHEFRSKKILSVLYAFIYGFFILAPLFIFYMHLSQLTGNFFAAIDIQKAWNNNQLKPLGYFISYFQTYGVTIRIEHILSFIFLVGIMVLFIGMLVRFLQKINHYKVNINEIIALFLYAFGSIILITSQTNLSSTFRHAVSNFAFFLLPVILMKRFSNKTISLYICVISAMMQVLFFILFLTGIPAYGF